MQSKTEHPVIHFPVSSEYLPASGTVLGIGIQRWPKQTTVSCLLELVI